MTLIAELKDDTTNIVTPPELQPGRTYFWRVNAVSSGGGTVVGPVWTFVVSW